MPSKWAKFSSRTGLSLAVAIAAAAGGFARSASAMTVTSTLGGATVSGTPDMTYYYAGSGATFYGDTEGFDFHAIDVTATQSVANGTGGEATPTNQVQFSVATDAPATGTTTTTSYLTVEALDTTGNNPRPIPIYSVNGISCQNGGACFQAVNYPVSGQNYGLSGTYYLGAAVTPGSTVTIGLYPKSVCQGYPGYVGPVSGGTSSGGGTAYGCTSNGTSTAVTLPATLKLRFNLHGLKSGSTAEIDFAGTAQQTKDHNLVFHTTTPSFSCPSNLADPRNFYTPGDGRIFFDTSNFAGAIAGGAPAYQVIVVGKAAPPGPDISAGFASNPIVKSLRISGLAEVPGFTNTTDGTDNLYDVSFIMRDASGLVATPGTYTSCYLNGVQTSSIEGFLKRNNCFIATAAFREGNAEPIALLRKFRDRILLPTSAGRAFVHWYYDWSPSAAGWLIEHPLFRYPVLLALVPLQILAWLALHPTLLATWAALAGIVLGALAWLGAFGWTKENR